MNFPQKMPNWLMAIILIIGVLAVSTASILIRLANISAGTSGIGFSLVLAASRLTLSAIIILPAWPKLLRQTLQPGAWLYASAAGLCLAVHFALWITSPKMSQGCPHYRTRVLPMYKSVWRNCDQEIN